MKVGDLVRFCDESAGEIGIITQCLNGWMLVWWHTGSMCSYPTRQLEVINESR
jgi:hypothetical protein